MDYTRKLSDFCASLKYESLPADVVNKTKQCMLDFIANVYGSLELEAVKGAIDYIQSLGTGGTATALGCGFKTDIHNAAFINGTTAEAIEAQDGLRFGGNHPGTAVIPAALALGDETGATGKDVIAAIVAGYEAANRAAASMHPHHTLSGFLPTGTCGTIGAAVATGSLREYGPEKMLNSLSNAGYLMPLSLAEQLMGGHTIKIVQGGQAALAGMMAAGLAGVGLTGTPYMLEGTALEGGFTQITTKKTGGQPVFERITDRLGEHYSIMDIYFKPYTACRHTHGSAQAVLELNKEKEIDVGNIDKVDVFTYGIATIAVGKEMPDNGTIVSAQFSIPYVVAACLMDGKLGPEQLTEKRLSDRKLIALSRKVHVSGDDELNKLYPGKTASRVKITMKSGEAIQKQVDIPIGDPRDPMDDSRLAEKVRLFSGSRNSKNVDEVIKVVMDLENLKNINDLTGII